MDTLNRLSDPIAGWVSKRCHVINKKAKDHKDLILERSVLSFLFLRNLRILICGADSQEKTDRRVTFKHFLWKWAHCLSHALIWEQVYDDRTRQCNKNVAWHLRKTRTFVLSLGVGQQIDMVIYRDPSQCDTRIDIWCQISIF